jgi:hypothetical protein
MVKISILLLTESNLMSEVGNALPSIKVAVIVSVCPLSTSTGGGIAIIVVELLEVHVILVGKGVKSVLKEGGVLA